MSDNFTTKTAAIKATMGSIRILNVKDLIVDGEDIGEKISNAKSNVMDERGTLANDDLDIWSSYISKDEIGNIIIKEEAEPIRHNYLSLSNSVKECMDRTKFVRNNKLKDSEDNHIMFWQSGGFTDTDTSMFSGLHSFESKLSSLTNGQNMFKESSIVSFSSDLGSLIEGNDMFSSCSNLTSFSGNLGSLVNGENAFLNCKKLNSFNCDNLSSLTNGQNMFNYCSSLKSFGENLDSLIEGYRMFYYCTNLNTFSGNLSSLVRGGEMFFNCNKLTSFKGNLSSLTDGNNMFRSCKSMTSFECDNLDSLSNGQYMFYNCYELSEFDVDMKNLIDGQYMFYYCKKLDNFTADLRKLEDGTSMFNNTILTSFDSNLESLSNGNYMFFNCANLLSFASVLSSLTSGNEMFHKCKLDPQSVSNILNFIPANEKMPEIIDGVVTTYLTIGFGINDSDYERLIFAQQCDFDTWDDLMDEFTNKNWILRAQFNGPSTYSVMRSNTPVYVKLIETDSSNYEYTSQDGSKFYNISWYHISNGNNEGYTLYDSMDVVLESLGVIPRA